MEFIACSLSCDSMYYIFNVCNFNSPQHMYFIMTCFKSMFTYSARKSFILFSSVMCNHKNVQLKPLFIKF